MMNNGKDFSGYLNAHAWEPIGTPDHPFNGTASLASMTPAERSGTGTEDDPYLIYYCEQLDMLATPWHRHHHRRR
ncbi:MAG: hypothetical protein IKI26_08190 [Prevotella sp.]|nr:hypothetical protein [Prevotella sp.]